MAAMLQPSLAGKCVLLTGATGLIGNAVLARLLRSDAARIICLVRAKHDRPALERLKMRMGQRSIDESLFDRVEILSGDLLAPEWGIEAVDRQMIENDVDIVIHSGATTYFQREEECRKANEEAVSHLIDMCTDAPRRKFICYLGSAACGGIQKDKTVFEDDYPTENDYHFVYYTKSKSNGERMLNASSKFYDLAIVRPSYVIPELTAPIKVISDCLWPLTSMLACSIVPVRDNAYFDFIQVETVVDYIMAIVTAGRPGGPYHVSSGELFKLTWSEILTFATQALDSTYLPEFVSNEDYAKSNRKLPKEERLRIGRLGLYLPFMNQNIVFDNSRVIGEYGQSQSLVDFLRDYLQAAMPQVQPR
jgi:thioester reductase-like protein